MIDSGALMTTLNIAEYYRYAELATAAYVRMGGNALDGATFAAQGALPTQSGGRVPLVLGTALFNPADASAQHWNVLNYYGNDSLSDSIAAADHSGFAATLFQDSVTGEKVLAMRGTEPDQDSLFGLPFGFDGVDLLSADLGQIGILSLALTQVVSMANYVMRLRAPTADTSVVQLRVAASSTQPASGSFLPVQGDEVGSTVYLTFSQAAPAVGLDKIHSGDVVTLTGHSLGGHLAAMAAMLFPDVFDPNVTVFNSAGYDPTPASLLGLWNEFSPLSLTAGIADLIKSSMATELGSPANSFDTHSNHLTSEALGTINGLLRPNDGVALGTPNVIFLRSEDVAPGDDTDAVASELTGTEHYSAPINVTTEANSHVIEPFMDSLSLHAFFYSMNQSLVIEDTNKILQAASHEVADTEETLLGSLYELMTGKVIELPLSDATKWTFNPFKTGKGDINARESYFEKLIELQDLVSANPSWSVSSLADMSSSELITRAGVENGLAYRYALSELNPFAILGPDSLYNDGFTDGTVTIPAHNASKQLDLYVSPATTPAGMTTQYIADRAQMLVFLSAANVDDIVSLTSDQVSAEVLYQDLAARSYVHLMQGRPTKLDVIPVGQTADPGGPNTQIVGFGADAADGLQGRNAADRLYGGLGADLLQGGKGNDYLEGGAGLDVYLFESGDGTDTVLDSDGKGTLLRDGSALALGVQQTADVWAQGNTMFTKSGSDLVVSFGGGSTDSISLKDFDFTEAATEQGYLGLHLVDQSVLFQPGRSESNPFDDPSFDPASAPSPAGTLKEGGGEHVHSLSAPRSEPGRTTGGVHTRGCRSGRRRRTK